MMTKQWLLHKILHTKIAISCMLITTVGVNLIALAGYKPPKDQKPPKDSSDSSGVRMYRKLVIRNW
ncbi:hypothetical protein [Nostoc sp. TCL26-01]|uniref:hypothetical protein n=1 Tax=Nostoc sp. TCL26-01 TaxID=2576904 RepID=UPI0015BC4AD7|nr:hypothetical protein [Nostoc sp. TCL26-01]